MVAGGVPDPVGCLLLRRVFADSPASLAGLEVGDLLISASGTPAAETTLAAGAELLFYSHRRKQRYRTTFSGTDPGFLAEPTRQTVLFRYQEEQPNPFDLLALWNSGQFSLLQKLTVKGLQSLNRSGFLERLRKKVVPANHPLTALHGACLFESGKTEQGLGWLEIYRSRYSRSHDPAFEALVSYYFALDRFEQHQEEEANSFLRFSILLSGLPRACSLWTKKHQELPLSAKVGHHFPSEVPLTEERGQAFSLQTRLADLSDSSHLLLAVFSEESECGGLLEWQRSNSGLFPELVEAVLCVVPERTATSGASSETFRYLEDREDRLRELVNSGDRSEYFLLDRDGVIKASSLHLDSIWELLSQRSAPSVVGSEEKLPGHSLPPTRAEEQPVWKRSQAGSGERERVLYLIPSERPIKLCDSGGSNVVSFPREQLEKRFGESRYQAWVRAYVLPPHTQNALAAQHFVLVEGSWPQGGDFAPLQSSLAACRSALAGGGLGVVDFYSRRWLSTELFQSFETDVFDVKEHIGMLVGNGFCLTQGLKQKFASPDFAMRLPSPHLAGAAVHLLYEIAHQAAQGKQYNEKSLFRWRSEAHLSQFMFRPADSEIFSNTIGVTAQDQEMLEVVDLAIEHGAVQPSSTAEVGLTYFTLGAPHWNLAFGWPPLPVPESARSFQEREINVFGLVPGLTTLEQAHARLGPAHKVAPDNAMRWLFQSPQGESPWSIEAHFTPQGQLLTVSGNSLARGRALSESSTRSHLEAVLGEPALERSFLAPPDQTPVRSELAWVGEHPTVAHHTLLLQVEMGGNDRLWKATLTHVAEAPQVVCTALEPNFGRSLLTGFQPTIPGRPKTLSQESRRLRTYMESSVQLIKQLIYQFGHSEWISEDLDGYSITVGSYLLGGGSPSRSQLEGLGLPAQLFLSSYRALEEFLEHPANQIRLNPTARERTLDPTTYAAFRWMLEALTGGHAREEELLLAVDLSQVFSQYKETLRQLASVQAPSASEQQK